MNLSLNFIIKVVKPLYALLESGLHWHLTYLNRYSNKLRMRRYCVDPCLLFTNDEKHLDGIVIPQVENSLIIGNEFFLVDEEKGSQMFISKEKQLLSRTGTLFN